MTGRCFCVALLFFCNKISSSVVVHSRVITCTHFLLLAGIVFDPKRHNVIEGRSLIAGDGILWVVAGQSGLVEDGRVATDERPVSGLHEAAEVVQEGQADVEYLQITKR